VPGGRLALSIAISAGDFAPPSYPNQPTPTTTQYIRTGRDLGPAPYPMYLQAGRCASLLVIQARPVLQTRSLSNIHLLLLTLQQAWSWPEAAFVLGVSQSLQRDHTIRTQGQTITILTGKSSIGQYPKAVTSVAGFGERMNRARNGRPINFGPCDVQRTHGLQPNQSREGSGGSLSPFIQKTRRVGLRAHSPSLLRLVQVSNSCFYTIPVVNS